MDTVINRGKEDTVSVSYRTPSTYVSVGAGSRPVVRVVERVRLVVLSEIILFWIYFQDYYQQMSSFTVGLGW